MNPKPLTSNIELINLCRSYNIPLDAVLYKNQLVNYDSNKTKSFIIDLHDDKDKSTGHWTALFKQNNQWFYFDPFGIIYPSIVKRFCNNKDIEYNTEQIQSFQSGYCGYYCFIFLYYMNQGKTLKFIQSLFNQFDNPQMP